MSSQWWWRYSNTLTYPWHLFAAMCFVSICYCHSDFGLYVRFSLSINLTGSNQDSYSAR
jgi:hypothetical protein